MRCYRVIFTYFVACSLLITPLSRASESIEADKPMIHQIYELVDQRNAESLVFDQALQSQDKIIQKTALLGLARIGGQIALEKITPMLNNDSSELRKLAALGVGLSQQKNAAELLWQRLEKEKDLQVKHELYLGLGNLAPDNLITRMLTRLDKEQQPETISAMFQGLAIALVFNRELKDDYQKIDYAKLLGLFAKGDTSHAMIGYFLNRIPGIENFLTVNDLLNISQQELSDEAKANLARLTAKITQKDNEKNREILAWLLEQSESSNIAVQQEALRAMRHLTSIPQALIQLGKHTKSTNPIVAHTALSTLGNSELASEEMIALFKGQLKHQNDAMVVEAIRGLLKRQEKDEMSWVVQLLRHPSSYVKISLISQLNAKSQDDFKNTIKFFTKDPNKEVAAYAKRIVDKVATPKNVQAISPSFSEVSKTTNQIVTLKTTVGKIKIQLLESAPYTAWHFMRNAREGTFNNAYFSRVIGNFVAQGGDSIGDLSGASNQTIREEISFLNHEPMTVGMATSGKDTGTSQFFINTGRNFHLDRNYTVFGKVIEGQKAVIQMTNGAKILSVETN